MSITKTQIDNMEAKTLLSMFQDLNNQLRQIKETLVPKQKIELMTRKEVSNLLGVSVVTVHNWGKKGIIKPYRIGNKVRYKRSEVLEALESINQSNAN